MNISVNLRHLFNLKKNSKEPLLPKKKNNKTIIVSSEYFQDIMNTHLKT